MTMEKMNEPVSQRLLALALDVGSAITQGASLSDMLNACVGAAVRNLDVSLARIWVLNEQTGMLDLAASAGIFGPGEGPIDSVAIGEQAVGGIAETKRPVLTNCVADTLSLKDSQLITDSGI